jgi:hypothetical protein
MKLSDEEFNFRAILNKLVIFKDRIETGKLLKQELNENSDSIITYCYIDEECGITFEYLCPFNIEKMALFVQKNKDYSHKIRFGSVLDFELLIIDNNKTDNKEIDKWIDIINENYDKKEGIHELRNYDFLDSLRVKDYPDDIFVGIFKNGLNGEGMYTKLWKKEGDKIFGKLLNEPYQDFGIHKNDIIELKFGKNSEGKLECFCEL